MQSGFHWISGWALSVFSAWFTKMAAEYNQPQSTCVTPYSLHDLFLTNFVRKRKLILPTLKHNTQTVTSACCICLINTVHVYMKTTAVTVLLRLFVFFPPCVQWYQYVLNNTSKILSSSVNTKQIYILDLFNNHISI